MCQTPKNDLLCGEKSGGWRVGGNGGGDGGGVLYEGKPHILCNSISFGFVFRVKIYSCVASVS